MKIKLVSIAAEMTLSAGPCLRILAGGTTKSEGLPVLIELKRWSEYLISTLGEEPLDKVKDDLNAVNSLLHEAVNMLISK